MPYSGFESTPNGIFAGILVAIGFLDGQAQVHCLSKVHSQIAGEEILFSGIHSDAIPYFSKTTLQSKAKSDNAQYVARFAARILHSE